MERWRRGLGSVRDVRLRWPIWRLHRQHDGGSDVLVAWTKPRVDVAAQCVELDFDRGWRTAHSPPGRSCRQFSAARLHSPRRGCTLRKATTRRPVSTSPLPVRARLATPVSPNSRRSGRVRDSPELAPRPCMSSKELDSPHASVSVAWGGQTLHTHQVISAADYGRTTIALGDSANAIRSFEYAIPNAAAAMQYQRSMMGAEMGYYNMFTNSCFTHCANVLSAGGVQPSTQLLRQWMGR